MRPKNKELAGPSEFDDGAITQLNKCLVWTRPYCGVSHLEGLPDGWQISLETYSPELTIASMVFPRRSLTPIKQFAGSKMAATLTAEQWALALIDEFGSARR